MYRYRTTKIIRPNATKETLKYEVRDIKEAIGECEKEIKRAENEAKRIIRRNKVELIKLNKRLLEMQIRYNQAKSKIIMLKTKKSC